MKAILYGIYRNIKNPELSLQYLAKEVLFMNEDYFGRFFFRYTNEKYSSFLVRIRVELAKRLMAFDPEIRISRWPSRLDILPTGSILPGYLKRVRA